MIKPVWPGVLYSSISPARFSHISEPELPGPRWVRVRNLMCGICSSDLSIFNVEMQPSIAPVALPGYQRLFLGHEVVGEVTETGPAVSRIRAGDRVIMDTRFHGPTCLSQEIEPLCRSCEQGNQTLCENASTGAAPCGIGGGWGDGFTAHESEVYAVPNHLSNDQAMMVEPLSIGCRAALRREITQDDKALIVGGGLVGLNTLQCLRAFYPRCNITIAVRHPHQARIAERQGANHVLLGGDLYEATAHLTGAKYYKGPLNNRMLLGGYDVVYDCVGTARTLRDCLRCVKARGTVILVGISLSRLKLDLTPVWFQEVDLIGVCGHGNERWKGESKHAYDLVISLLKQGKLSIHGLITHRYPLRDWRQAIVAAANRRNDVIRVVLDIDDGRSSDSSLAT
jgi:L-iditol 2-dehydrogenase